MRVLIFGPRRVTPCLAVVAMICGCGGGADGLQRESVFGRVTIDGTPLEQGSIQFLPTQSDPRAAAWSRIEHGEYSIRRAEGPVAGEYSVSITSASPGTVSSDELPGDDSGLSDTDAIPERYNLRTTLKATVEAGKDNELNYDLTTDPVIGATRRP